MSSNNNTLLYFPKKQFSKRFGEKFFTISIIGNVTKLSDIGICEQGNVVYYTIQIQCGTKIWTIEKRFSEFIKFHYEILDLINGEANIPTLPPKTWFKVTDPIDIKSREEQLEVYLEDTLILLSKHNLMLVPPSPIKEFFKFNSLNESKL
jgi:hypothetical protein